MIRFTTNLDKYQTNCFPTNLQHLPRVGDYIQVVDVFKSHYQSQRLPIKLEVKRVTHTDKGVICELWLSKIDAEIIKENKINIFG